MEIEEKDIFLIFRLTNEEDINKLVLWNNLIVKRIKILQISQNVPKAPVTEKKNEEVNSSKLQEIAEENKRNEST